ncbi:DegV family protein [Alitiscatomonas aceti]|uniref:DegV family protein n=1 Tax=Alitiscatomonas aceti TaxID=2981724 RepID=A0ABT2UVR8_9FIRM|nr:DegV family protein [Alitiscatomonas aceti]MCU6798748.1 DegV family protein [Alitiscatomonas aceti]
MVQIVTDSSVLYTEEEAKAAGFDVIPLCVSVGDMDGRDLQIDMEEFYGRIGKGEIPRSSQPPIGDVVEVYEKYQDADVLNICVADGLSGTYHGALSARDMVENRDRITVFNSRTLCGPHRYMVEKAQKMKEEGKGIPEILEWLKSAAEKTESFLIPQDFGFLKRGGRLTPVAAALGSVLKLKPVMRLTEDGTRLDKFFVKRTMSAAVSGIMDHMKKKGIDGRYLLYIVHAAAPKEAGAIREMIEAEFKGIGIQMMDLSPVFVAQGGPGCVAIQYIER